MEDIIIIQIESIRFKIMAGAYDWFWRAVAEKDWEQRTFTIIKKFISQQTTFFDLGAWIGPLTLYAACLAKNVYAFEPDPVAFDELSNNIHLNPRLKNIVICNYFVGSASGKRKIGNKSSIGNSRSSIFYAKEKTNWEVTSVNLVQFIKSNNIEPPYFIKIDIEGAEFEVVDTLRYIFKNYDTTLYLSLHPQYLASVITGRSLVAKIKRKISLLCVYLNLIQGLRFLRYKCDDDGNRIRFANIKMLINGLLLKEYIVLAMNRRYRANTSKLK